VALDKRKEVDKLYLERLQTLTAAISEPRLDDIDMVLLSSVRNDVATHFAFVPLIHSLNDQLSQFLSKLDSIENGINDIKSLWQSVEHYYLVVVSFVFSTKSLTDSKNISCDFILNSTNCPIAGISCCISVFFSNM
jgi:hypothetical protein